MYTSCDDVMPSDETAHVILDDGSLAPCDEVSDTGDMESDEDTSTGPGPWVTIQVMMKRVTS